MAAILEPNYRLRMFSTPNTFDGGPSALVFLPTSPPAGAAGYPVALFFQ